MHRRDVEGEGKNCEILWVQRIAVDVAAESPKQSIFITTNTSNVDEAGTHQSSLRFFGPRNAAVAAQPFCARCNQQGCPIVVRTISMPVHEQPTKEEAEEHNVHMSGVDKETLIFCGLGTGNGRASMVHVTSKTADITQWQMKTDF